jgi:hypothetical protein
MAVMYHKIPCQMEEGVVDSSQKANVLKRGVLKSGPYGIEEILPNPSTQLPSLTPSLSLHTSHQHHHIPRATTHSQWVSLTSFPRLVSTVSSSAPPSLLPKQVAHRKASTVADGWISPQQLGFHPQLHRRVRLRNLLHLLRPPHPQHHFPDEHFWSVFLRRLKTPLNEDKTIRVLRTSDLSISALILRYLHCTLLRKQQLTATPAMVLPRPMSRPSSS